MQYYIRRRDANNIHVVKNSLFKDLQNKSINNKKIMLISLIPWGGSQYCTPNTKIFSGGQTKNQGGPRFLYTVYIHGWETSGCRDYGFSVAPVDMKWR